MKQSTTSHSESDASSTSGENSPESGEKCKAKQLDDYYNKDNYTCHSEIYNQNQLCFYFNLYAAKF